jgi:non-heme chloroperoxidase
VELGSRPSPGDHPEKDYRRNQVHLKKFDVPTLIIHGDDDQIVPIGASAMLSSKIVKDATLKIYPGAPHGLIATHKDQVNEDLLAFLKS